MAALTQNTAVFVKLCFILHLILIYRMEIKLYVSTRVLHQIVVFLFLAPPCSCKGDRFVEDSIFLICDIAAQIQYIIFRTNIILCEKKIMPWVIILTCKSGCCSLILFIWSLCSIYYLKFESYFINSNSQSILS